jgi:hypothetical protein
VGALNAALRAAVAMMRGAVLHDGAAARRELGSDADEPERAFS